MNIVAKRYAQALFDSVESKKDLGQLMTTINSYETTFKGSTVLRQFFETRTLSDVERLEVLTALETSAGTLKKAEELVFRCLKVMAQANRLRLVFEVFSAFRELYRLENNIMIAEVHSVAKCDDKVLAQIKTRLEKRFKKEIEISTVLDKTLLGGVKIKAGSYLFDDSMKTRLETIRRHVKEA